MAWRVSLLCWLCGCGGSLGLVPGGWMIEKDGGVTIVIAGAPDSGTGQPMDDAGVCQNGQQFSCYDGPPSTLGHGSGCHTGTSTCVNGNWGPCEGELVPKVGLTDVVFELDDVDQTCQEGVPLSEFITWQSNVVLAIYNTTSPLYRWMVVDLVGCGATIPTQTAGFTDQQQALAFASIQCVGNSGVTCVEMAPQIHWDVGARQLTFAYGADGGPSLDEIIAALTPSTCE